MTKVQKETLIGLLRTTVRETAWAVVKGKAENDLITEGISASICAYESACSALRYVDPKAGTFIAYTFQAI